MNQDQSRRLQRPSGRLADMEIEIYGFQEEYIHKSCLFPPSH